MKTKQLFFVATIGLASSCLAMAQTDFSEMDKLNERRRALEARQSKLNLSTQQNLRVSQRIGIIRQIQDKTLNGPEGVLKRIESYQAKVDAWISSWEVLMSSLENVSSDQVLTVATTFKEKTTVLLEKYEKLDVELTDLLGLTQSCRAEIEGQEKIPVGFSVDSDLNKYSEALELQSTRLVSMLNAAEASLLKTRGKDFHAQMEMSNNYIQAKLRNIMLRFPELSAKIAEAQSLLNFISSADPTIAELRTMYSRLRADLTARRLFRADALIESIISKGNAAEAEWNDFPLSAQLKAGTISQVQTLRSQAKKSYEDTNNALPRANQTFVFITNQRKFLTSECKNPQKSGLYDCESLRVLNQINVTLPIVKSWDSSRLKLFEEQLTKIMLANQGQTK